MSNASESAFARGRDVYERADFYEERRSAGAYVQLTLAMLGLVSLAYMLWTIARTLGVI